VDEQQMYADPKRRIMATNKAVRQRIEETIEAPKLLQWAQVRKHTSHEFGMTVHEFSKRCPWAKQTYRRAAQERLAEDKRQAELARRRSALPVTELVTLKPTEGGPR
jgi:hypothetical protein